jgi:hypothetical protein
MALLKGGVATMVLEARFSASWPFCPDNEAEFIPWSNFLALPMGFGLD